MVVYIDILLFVNSVIDYLLISVASAITGRKIKGWRLVASAMLASCFSLLILLPYLGYFLEILTKSLSLIPITVAAFGFHSFGTFLKNYLSLFTVSIVFNGIVTVIWFIFKPQAMLMNNSVVYFNISALELILYTILAYFVIKLVLSIIRRTAPYAKRCNILLQDGENYLELTGLVDTGNSLKDIYFGRQVIITDKNTATMLFGSLESRNMLLLPYKTVNGTGTISAYICKKAFVNNVNAGSVLIAVCNEALDDDYKAIVNPEIFNAR